MIVCSARRTRSGETPESAGVAICAVHDRLPKRPELVGCPEQGDAKVALGIRPHAGVVSGDEAEGGHEAFLRAMRALRFISAAAAAAAACAGQEFR